MAAPSTVPASLASLYVGDLHQDITDGQLFSAFSEFKSLVSVRICRDTSSGRSLCYGYVNFTAPEDANRAIEVKNHTMLSGKMIRVMCSHRDSDARRSGVGNVFVKNLSDSIDNVKLQELFQKFGNILSCKVAIYEDGKSKGHGYVQFESEESANAAIEKLNCSSVGGKEMYVAKFVKKSNRVLCNPDSKYTNLYIKNFDSDVTEEFLKNKFFEFGKITSLVISKDENGTSRGFGFVNFENPDDARQAMEAMNGSKIGSKVFYVSRAQKKAYRQQILHQQIEEKRKVQTLKYQGSNVYVKNIDDDVTDEALREHFSQCGTITSAKLMRDDAGMSKGFGFVCFSTPEEANKSVNAFHGCMFHRKPLYVAIAQRKNERQAQFQHQYAQCMEGSTGSSVVNPAGYPSLVYTASASPGVSLVPPQPGFMYQPLGLRPGWGAAYGVATPTGPDFQPPPLPLINNNSRPRGQNKGRMTAHMLQQGSGYTLSYMPRLQYPTQSVTSSKNSSNKQRSGQVKYVPSGRLWVVNKGSEVPSGASNVAGSGAEGSEMLSSMLAAALPEQQKQILGDRLYPLVYQLKPDLSTKITGMLLEMDNSELLLLLESPESLASKVEEAAQLIKLSKRNVSDQEAVGPSYPSVGVAVN